MYKIHRIIERTFIQQKFINILGGAHNIFITNSNEQTLMLVDPILNGAKKPASSVNASFNLTNVCNSKFDNSGYVLKFK